MTDHIIINDIQPNTCFICDKPYFTRSRYLPTDTRGVKEVEFILAHPTCRSYDRVLDEYMHELYCFEVERKGHSREVRELNKKIKEIKQKITDVEYKKFLRKHC